MADIVETLPRLSSVDDFLRWEDRQEGKHEFDGETIIPMTGGSRAHQRIVMNLVAALEARLEPTSSCYEVIQEMRLRIGKRAARYPDVCIVLGPVADNVKTLDDAIVVFEVLSPETAATDLGAKAREYRELSSFRAYVLIDQSRAHATVVTSAGTIETTTAIDLTYAGPLGDRPLLVPLSAIYARTSVRA
ncbi:MAG: Uma2 family endonuclease [Acetobacteraceae bacterium]